MCHIQAEKCATNIINDLYIVYIYINLNKSNIAVYLGDNSNLLKSDENKLDN